MPLFASTLAAEFGLTLLGVDREIGGPARLFEARAGDLTWLLTLGAGHRALADGLDGAVVLAPGARDDVETAFLGQLSARNAVLVIPDLTDPRLAFARFLSRHFAWLEVRVPPGVDPSARVDPTARLGNDVTIGAFCFVGAEVEIGDETVLHPGAVVHSRTVVGRRCIVGSNCVVGTRGFGFVREPDGHWTHFPQTGRVVLEDDVELQAGTIVARPGMGETRILRGSKIDAMVHVGHGSRIGPDAIVTACAEIGAEVVVGEGAWVGPQACTLERVTIGAGARVGLGGVVVHDVLPGAVVAGSPAEPTGDLRRKRQALARLADVGDEGAH